MVEETSETKFSLKEDKIEDAVIIETPAEGKEYVGFDDNDKDGKTNYINIIILAVICFLVVVAIIVAEMKGWI